MLTLKEIYGHRFSDSDVKRKDAIWKEVARYLQRYIPEQSVVLDLACDRGDFIRNIRAAEKWASDLRDMGTALPFDVRFVQVNGLELDMAAPSGHFDLVFMSNYLEHLPTPESVIQQLSVVHRLLKPGGRVLVLQPNIRLVGGRYWDFIDHSVALTEKSLEEAAQLAGFRTRRVITRFLPYSTKSRLPQNQKLVRLYLAFPPAWRFLGKQTLYIGEK